LAKAVLLVEGDSGEIGLADFEEDASDTAAAEEIEDRSQQSARLAFSAVRVPDREVQNLCFVSDLATDDKAGDVACCFADIDGG